MFQTLVMFVSWKDCPVPCSGSFTGVKSVKCCVTMSHEDQFNAQPFADVTAKAAQFPFSYFKIINY